MFSPLELGICRQLNSLLAQGTDQLAKRPGAHVEVTAVEYALEGGLKPRAIVTSWDICDSCAEYLESHGAKVSGRVAQW